MTRQPKEIRRPIIWVTASIVLVAVSGFVWSMFTDDPLRLKITRRTVENGREVVYFRIEGRGQRPLMITWSYPNMSTAWPSPFYADESPLNGSSGRNEFGVLAPTNTSVGKGTVWKLESYVALQERQRGFFKTTLELLKNRRPLLSRSTFNYIRNLWHEQSYYDQPLIESDWITNSTSELVTPGSQNATDRVE